MPAAYLDCCSNSGNSAPTPAAAAATSTLSPYMLRPMPLPSFPLSPAVIAGVGNRDCGNETDDEADEAEEEGGKVVW